MTRFCSGTSAYTPTLYWSSGSPEKAKAKPATINIGKRIFQPNAERSRINSRLRGRQYSEKATQVHVRNAAPVRAKNRSSRVRGRICKPANETSWASKVRTAALMSVLRIPTISPCTFKFSGTFSTGPRISERGSCNTTSSKCSASKVLGEPWAIILP